MPLYEYQCDKCAHRFEVIQKYSDPHVDICPKCGGPVKKLLSSPAIQFKGTGWYITDYARAGKSDTGSTVASGENKSGSSSEGKSEGKSESGGSEKKTESKSGTSESKSDLKSDSKSDSKS